MRNRWWSSVVDNSQNISQNLGLISSLFLRTRMDSILSVFLKESNDLTFLSQRLSHQKALLVWTEIFFVKATKTRNAYQETWKSMECWRSRAVAMAIVPAIFHLLLQIYLCVTLPILWPGRLICKATLAGPFAYWLTVGFSEWGCPVVIKTKEDSKVYIAWLLPVHCLWMNTSSSPRSNFASRLLSV